MKETQRIIKLFEDGYNGSPWIDVNLVGTLSTISAEQAAKKVFANCNSIWEIANHIINWRINVLHRVKGEIIITPDSNYFTTVKDTSLTAWKNTLKQLEESQKNWIAFLKEFKEKDFTKVYPNNKMTYYEHIQGILQHDAYHLGQIVLLAKSC